jgi:hypothetical protein
MKKTIILCTLAGLLFTGCTQTANNRLIVDQLTTSYDSKFKSLKYLNDELLKYDGFSKDEAEALINARDNIIKEFDRIRMSTRYYSGIEGFGLYVKDSFKIIKTNIITLVAILDKHQDNFDDHLEMVYVATRDTVTNDVIKVEASMGDDIISTINNITALYQTVKPLIGAVL